MKISKLIQNFFAGDSRRKVVLGLSALLLIFLVGVSLPTPSLVRDGLVYLLAASVIASIYFLIISSSYDFKAKKLRVVDIWSVLTWVFLLLLMSIGGGFFGWLFLATSLLFFVIQLSLRLCVLLRRINSRTKGE